MPVIRVHQLIDGMTVIVDGIPSTIAPRGITRLGSNGYRLTFTNGRKAVYLGRVQLQLGGATA